MRQQATGFVPHIRPRKFWMCSAMEWPAVMAGSRARTIRGTESTDSPRIEAACLRNVLPAPAGDCPESARKRWAPEGFDLRPLPCQGNALLPSGQNAPMWEVIHLRAVRSDLTSL